MHRRLRQLLCAWPAPYSEALRRWVPYGSERALYLRLTRPGDTVIDVGANRGFYTVLFSHRVGRTGRVHAFEPIPPTFEALRSQVTRGTVHPNVALTCAAVGAAPGKVTLHVPGEDDGQASAVRHSVDSWAGSPAVLEYECPLITLDGYAESGELAGPALVKVDVEGGELAVLRGGERLIRRTGPILSLEVYNAWLAGFGVSAQDLLGWVAEAGYDRFLLVGDRNEWLDLPILLREEERFDRSSNLFCFQSRRHPDRLKAVEHFGRR